MRSEFWASHGAQRIVDRASLFRGAKMTFSELIESNAQNIFKTWVSQMSMIASYSSMSIHRSRKMSYAADATRRMRVRRCSKAFTMRAR